MHQDSIISALYILLLACCCLALEGRCSSPFGCCCGNYAPNNQLMCAFWLVYHDCSVYIYVIYMQQMGQLLVVVTKKLKTWILYLKIDCLYITSTLLLHFAKFILYIIFNWFPGQGYAHRLLWNLVMCKIKKYEKNGFVSLHFAVS
jgi:hypothetical protein